MGLVSAFLVECGIEAAKYNRGNESKLTEPVVDPEVGDKVPDEHVGQAKGVAEVVESGASENQTNVTEDNELCILGLVERAAGVKVVDAAAKAVLLALATALTLALVVVVASDVGEEVVGPANELLGNEHGESEGRRVLGKLCELVGHAAETSSLLLTGAGDKDHVTLHVAGGLVVLAVGDLPAKVGDQEGRVEDPAGNVVDEARLGKGAVTALVGNDPETGAEEALDKGVDGPKSTADESVGNVLGGDKVVEDGKGGGQARHVTQDISVALEGRTLKAVLGDGIADILDGVVGRSELVAVGVDELAIVGLGVADIDRGERRERGGRGRRARRVGGGDGG